MADLIVRDFRNLRFRWTPVPSRGNAWIMNVERVSDGVPLHGDRQVQAWTEGMPDAEKREEMVDAWIMHAAGNDEPPPTPCARCGAWLRPVHGDTAYQFENALHVRFGGGYGMFIDPCGDPRPEALICHECAHALCTAESWLADLLEPGRSHAHRADDYPRLIAEGHEGWDLPKGDA